LKEACQIFKDQQVVGAFSKTFVLAAIILVALSGVGLFTDRKKKPEFM
jgi:hypothetical protein